ncbi:hypothetical protein BDW59DRAFT_171576 [Aspergillus cavernicola]|uniref:Uncharacterized protein n=1 Tax=Aspergillus cavernicola TaxID=176166 RepID=A0ABR4IIJ0_9EURO
MSLIPIITTHEIPPTIDSAPTLLLLTESDGKALRQYTYDAVSYLPIDSFQSPFLGWDLGKMPTATDEDTLLLVHNMEGSLQNVRLSAAYVNTEAISVSVAVKGCGGVNGASFLMMKCLDSAVGQETGQPPKQGGQAPRKQF